MYTYVNTHGRGGRKVSGARVQGGLEQVKQSLLDTQGLIHSKLAEAVVYTQNVAVQNSSMEK